MSKETKCVVKQCRSESDIFYYGLPLCDKHWAKLCDLPTDKMKEKLGIKVERKDDYKKTI